MFSSLRKRLIRKSKIGRVWTDENGLRIASAFSTNGRGEVRAYVQEYEGRELAHVRHFVLDKNGHAVPTRKGIAVEVGELRKLAEAVAGLLAAVELGH